MNDTAILDYLHEQFPRVHSKLDAIQADLSDVALRMSALAVEAGHSRIAVAEVNSRLDRLDAGLERIERRLMKAKPSVS